MPSAFQQAATEAMAEHSAPEPNEPAVSSSPEPEASPAPNEAPAAPSGDVPADTPTPDTNDLISEAELSALQTKHAQDPTALAKELKAVFTKKTQALAETRKSLERMAPYQELIQQLEEDGIGTVTALAQQLGLTVGPAPAEAAAVAQAAPLADATMEQFRTALGPDLAFLADSLAPAVKAMAEQIAKQTVESTVGPLKAAQQTLLEKAAVEQSGTILRSFEQTHPDWKTHEPAMLKLAAKVQPNGMPELEYLDLLYTHVTHETRVASDVKAALARMTKGAQTAETRTDGTPQERVDTTPPRNLTIREAFAASKAEAARR